MKVLEGSLNGNTLADWAIAFGIVVAVIVVLFFGTRALGQRLEAHARRTNTRVAGILSELILGTHLPFLIVVAVYLGSLYLELAPKAERIITSVTVIALLLQAALWGHRAIAHWLTHTLATRRETDAPGATTASVLAFVARIVLWSVVLLMALDNVGVNVTTLVASLGIGGIAVALAVQNILGDIFASLSIALDKPFLIGDFIVVDNVMGTVEYIGLKTTRLRALSGELVIFANADLLRSRIRNYKQMKERRVVFGFGVLYQTAAAKLGSIPVLVRDIIRAQPATRFDRAHFKEFGDSALVFEVVYYVLDADYNRYMDIQQAINLAIFRRFQEERIEFAFPTRMLYISNVARDPGKAAAGDP